MLSRIFCMISLIPACTSITFLLLHFSPSFNWPSSCHTIVLGWMSHLLLYFNCRNSFAVYLTNSDCFVFFVNTWLNNLQNYCLCQCIHMYLHMCVCVFVWLYMRKCVSFSMREKVHNICIINIFIYCHLDFMPLWSSRVGTAAHELQVKNINACVRVNEWMNECVRMWANVFLCAYMHACFCACMCISVCVHIHTHVCVFWYEHSSVVKKFI